MGPRSSGQVSTPPGLRLSPSPCACVQASLSAMRLLRTGLPHSGFPPSPEGVGSLPAPGGISPRAPLVRGTRWHSPTLLSCLPGAEPRGSPSPLPSAPCWAPWHTHTHCPHPAPWALLLRGSEPTWVCAFPTTSVKAKCAGVLSPLGGARTEPHPCGWRAGWGHHGAHSGILAVGAASGGFGWVRT